MKANSKIAIGVFAGLIVGVGIGFLIAGYPPEDGNNQGNIAKVSKYKNSVVSPQMSAFQEKIQNDPEEFQAAAASLVFLTSRMSEFDLLVEVAEDASLGVSELESSVQTLQKVQKLAANAKESGKQAIAAFDQMSSSKAGGAEYEQASQNLTLAYLMVDRQVNVGKQFVCDVDSYLKGKDTEENIKLAAARDLWANYCACAAVIDQDEAEMAYWNKQNSIIPAGDLCKVAGEAFQGPISKVGVEDVPFFAKADGGAIAKAGDGAIAKAGDGALAKADGGALAKVGDGVISKVDGYGIFNAFGSINNSIGFNGVGVPAVPEVKAVRKQQEGGIAMKDGSLFAKDGEVFGMKVTPELQGAIKDGIAKMGGAISKSGGTDLGKLGDGGLANGGSQNLAKGNDGKLNNNGDFVSKVMPSSF